MLLLFFVCYAVLFLLLPDRRCRSILRGLSRRKCYIASQPKTDLKTFLAQICSLHPKNFLIAD